MLFSVTASPQKGGISHCSTLESHSCYLKERLLFQPVCLNRWLASSLLYLQHHHQHLPPPVLALLPKKRQAMTELCNCMSKGLAEAADSFYNSDWCCDHLPFVSVLQLKTVCVTAFSTTRGCNMERLCCFLKFCVYINASLAAAFALSCPSQSESSFCTVIWEQSCLYSCLMFLLILSVRHRRVTTMRRITKH